LGGAHRINLRELKRFYFMFAQLYKTDRVIRIFDGDVVSGAGEAYADLMLPGNPSDFKKAGGIALTRMGLTMVSRWRRTEWGWQGNVEFRTRR
jgi:hypothetical protein